MTKIKRAIGIDIGSVSISLAEIDDSGRFLSGACAFHKGQIKEKLEEMLAEFSVRAEDGSPVGLARTSTSPDFFPGTEAYDSRIAYITAARSLHSRPGSILIVGGEKFGIIRFDENGDYHSFLTNSSCAAGTGSFLDQQARRLGLSGSEELSRIALMNRGDLPAIASRCAVFAKTDLIHAQQEGFSLEEICDGLCRGLARNVVDTLFAKDIPRQPVVFIGGVSRNAAVARHISSLIGADLVIDEHSALYGAIGAALCLVEERKLSSAPLMFHDTAPGKPRK